MTDTMVNATFINDQLPIEKSEKLILFQDRDIYFANYQVVDAKRADFKNSRFLDLTSRNNKIFISTNVGIYNFFYTVLGSIIRANKSNPDSELIIDPTQVNIGYDNRYFLPMLSRILNELNIKHRVVNFNNYDGVLANNFSIANPGGLIFSKEDVADMNKLYLKLSGATDDKPFKKVYVSRKNVVDNRDFANFLKPGLSFTRDFRVENEPMLEGFLSNLGFEIVYPEEFQSMEAQMKFFSEVDVLVSVTSSGIANSLFMKPGGTIVEFGTTFGIPQPFGAAFVSSEQLRNREIPQPPYEGVESLHNIYRDLCYRMDHTYVSVSNYTRNAQEICDRITNLKHFKELFNLEK